MSRHRTCSPISREDIQAAFTGEDGKRFPPILNVQQLSELTSIPRSTIYEWHSRGLWGSAARTRGKRLLFWRDRAIDVIFNGPDWS
ncbi:MAG: hypothetical protein KDA68_04215 [Planctomycetaceae bacterium]|nr:hypothetical protein [Planctomycetaceae bacterium]